MCVREQYILCALCVYVRKKGCMDVDMYIHTSVHTHNVFMLSATVQLSADFFPFPSFCASIHARALGIELCDLSLSVVCAAPVLDQKAVMVAFPL